MHVQGGEDEVFRRMGRRKLGRKKAIVATKAVLDVDGDPSKTKSEYVPSKLKLSNGFLGHTEFQPFLVC